MFFYGVRRRSRDDSDFRIRFPFGYPVKDFGFARGQPQTHQCFRPTIDVSMLKPHQGQASRSHLFSDDALSGVEADQKSGAEKTEPFLRDPDLVEILRIALENAFRQIEPYQLLFLRLVYIHSVRREHLAQIWGCHVAKIGRDMAAAEERIGILTLEYIRLIHPFTELRWSDCQAICEEYPSLLYGSAEQSRRL
jgi:hypothetical protein